MPQSLHVNCSVWMLPFVFQNEDVILVDYRDYH